MNRRNTEPNDMDEAEKIKLYKFRSLGDDAVDWTQKIIKTGKFWCSTLWEQNDTMEGTYSYFRKRVTSESCFDIFEGKNSYRICSFSSRRALKDPRMWGYYANGFKGIAVEIEIESHIVDKVNYRNTIPCVDIENPEIKKILTTKLIPWRFESEYRFLTNSEEGETQIGQITGIYFGHPYGLMENKEQIISKSSKLENYFRKREELIEIAKGIGYPCFSVGFVKNNQKWKVSWEKIDPTLTKKHNERQP